MSEFRSTYWKILIPPDWSARQDPECATFERKSGAGALQISAARKNGLATDEDLREFAGDHLAAGAKAPELKIGDFSGFVLRYSDGSHYWRERFLRNGETAVLVTYNFPFDSGGDEDEIVDAVLYTLRKP